MIFSIGRMSSFSKKREVPAQFSDFLERGFDQLPAPGSIVVHGTQGTLRILHQPVEIRPNLLVRHPLGLWNSVAEPVPVGTWLLLLRLHYTIHWFILPAPQFSEYGVADGGQQGEFRQAQCGGAHGNL